MSAHRIICALGVAISAAVPINIPAAHADPCPAVEVVFARGTGQAPGVGQVGQGFIDSLGSQIAGRSMDVYAVNHPGTTAFASSAPYNAKTVDLCADGDPACSGGGNLMAHGSYVASGMTAQAASFVAGRL